MQIAADDLVDVLLAIADRWNPGETPHRLPATEEGVVHSLDVSSGSWDTHVIPGLRLRWNYQRSRRWFAAGLRPFDHNLITTLVSDLEERGLLDDSLVIAMGEFGRTPNMGTQGSTDGCNHWPVVMSMSLAGGGRNDWYGRDVLV